MNTTLITRGAFCAVAFTVSIGITNSNAANIPNVTQAGTKVLSHVQGMAVHGASSLVHNIGGSLRQHAPSATSMAKLFTAAPKTSFMSPPVSQPGGFYRLYANHNNFMNPQQSSVSTTGTNTSANTIPTTGTTASTTPTNVSVVPGSTTGTNSMTSSGTTGSGNGWGGWSGGGSGYGGSGYGGSNGGLGSASSYYTNNQLLLRDANLSNDQQFIQNALKNPNLTQQQQQFLQGRLTALQSQQTNINTALDNNLSSQQTQLQGINTNLTNKLNVIQGQQTALTSGSDPFTQQGVNWPTHGLTGQLASYDSNVYNQGTQLQNTLQQGNLSPYQSAVLQSQIAGTQAQESSLNGAIGQQLTQRQTTLQGFQTNTQNELTQVQSEESAINSGNYNQLLDNGGIAPYTNPFTTAATTMTTGN